MNHQVKSCWVVETPIFISNVALVIMRKFKAPQGVTNYCKLKTICMNSEWCQKWRCALSLSVIVINTIIRQHLKSEWNCSGTTNEREMIRKPRFLQTCWRIFQTRFFCLANSYPRFFIVQNTAESRNMPSFWRRLIDCLWCGIRFGRKNKVITTECFKTGRRGGNVHTS